MMIEITDAVTNALLKPKIRVSHGDVSNEVCHDLIFANFNQDITSLAVGSNYNVFGCKGAYKVLSLSSIDSLEQIYENDETEVYLAERLFSSSLVALVSKSAPRKLSVWNFAKQKEICNYGYTTKILSLKLNRIRLVVCLEESIFIHNVRDMKVIHTIRNIPPNTRGLCALSTESDYSYLAYPGHSTAGEVQVFDAKNLNGVFMIPAHTGPLVAIQFSSSGTQIATASDKGTVIRVYCVINGYCTGKKLFGFRRGIQRTAKIYSLSFSPCDKYLACSSNTETLHVFKLDATRYKNSVPSEQETDQGSVLDRQGSSTTSSSDQTWMGYISNMVQASANYIHTEVTETLQQGRAFATVYHRLQGLHNICALAMIEDELRVLMTSSNGYLYIYDMNIHKGGD